MRIKTLLAFFRKDFADAVGSQTLLFVLLGPVLLSIFFAQFLNTGDVRQPVLYVCQDAPSAFVQSLQSVELFRIENLTDWNEAVENVNASKGCGAVLIPKHFDRDVRAGTFPVLQLVVNESSLTQATIAREGVRAALRLLANQELPVDLRVTKVNAFKGSARLAILPIWIVFTCMGGLMITSSTLIEEIENKTLVAVLLAPVSLAELLIGKILVGFGLAFIASLLIVIINCGSSGSFFSLILLLAFGSLLAALGGVIVGINVRSQASAGAANSVLYLILFVPVVLADLSSSMQSMSSWLPTWYLYDGVNKALFSGAAPSALLSNFWGLSISLLLLLLLGVLSVFKLRKKV